MTNHYQELTGILERLSSIQRQEDQQHMMHWQLTFSTRELVDEFQAQLADELNAYQHGYQ